jgi:ABC-type bacteriocin/lantibiotic exporter with double-glycine peptidase domain
MLSEFKKILALLFPFWKKYWKNEIVIVAMLIFSFFISLYTPLKFQVVVDSLVNHDSYSSFAIAVSLLGFLVLKNIN